MPVTRIGVRKATQEDKPLFLEWLKRNAQRNLIDPDVLNYPATTVLCAFDVQTGKPLLYMPVTTVCVLESLAPSPEATDMQLAKSLEKMFDVVVWDSRATGKGEILFECSDESLGKKVENYGFKRIGLPVMKVKI